MKRIIEKASVLIEALPYIQAFRGKKMVIKCGGSVMEDDSGLRDLLRDVVFMKSIGIQPVLVHGGGPAISKAMKEAGIQPQFVHGLRVTDEATMAIVEKVLTNKINQQLVDILNEMDANAIGVYGREYDLIRVEKNMPLVDGQSVDIGYVGEVVHINAGILYELLQQEKIPVIAPIGIGEDEHSYNINADTAAGFIASSIGAWKLVYLTDTPGLLRQRDDENSLISSLSYEEAQELLQSDIIKDGMRPKMVSCLKALKYGVKKAHIIDGRVHHSLLLEIFTNQGVGTEIVKNGL